MNTSEHYQVNPLKEPNLMEQEINHTRERIGRTVEELEQRLSPGQLVDQALGFARDHGGNFASNVAGSVRRNPLPMIVTGVGLLWLLKSQSNGSTRGARNLYTPYDEDDSRYSGDASSSWDERDWSSGSDNGANRRSGRLKERLSGVGEAIKSGVTSARDRVSAVGGSVSETVRSAKDDLSGRTQGALGSAQGTTRAVRERVGGASRGAVEQARKAKDEFSTLMEEQPLLMGAVGIAIGATIAALMPATRREKELMGRVSDTVADKASEIASEGYENLRETAAQSVDEFTRSLGKDAEPAANSGQGSDRPAWDAKSKQDGESTRDSSRSAGASTSSGTAGASGAFGLGATGQGTAPGTTQGTTGRSSSGQGITQGTTGKSSSGKESSTPSSGLSH